jgi:hypothetical protein
MRRGTPISATFLTCVASKDPWLDAPTAVAERLAEIATRFWLASACDRHPLHGAAAKVVTQHRGSVPGAVQASQNGRGLDRVLGRGSCPLCRLAGAVYRPVTTASPAKCGGAPRSRPANVGVDNTTSERRDLV